MTLRREGQRFPMEACLSGWPMLHREAVAIPDICADPRVPTAAYAYRDGDARDRQDPGVRLPLAQGGAQ